MSRLRPWLILLGLTAYAAFSCFFMLDRPTLWGDEVSTYYRTSGDFDHLMNRLKRDGFVPLHYIADWWLAQRVIMTPFWLRAIPAVCGVLFVPVMYLLARQFFSQRTALVAAALAATSAWVSVHARDAKMYMDTWLFVALGVALLMIWLRQTGWRSLLFWPGWVVCASISVWLHATAIAVVAIYPLFLLVRLPRHHWYQKDLLILGMLLVLAQPWWYYTRYNTFIDRTGIIAVDELAEGSRPPNWGSSGLTWIAQHNKDQAPLQLTLNTAASIMIGIQWPREGSQDPSNHRVQPSPWFKTLAAVSMSAVLVLLALGVLPWPRRWRGGTPPNALIDDVDSQDVIRRSAWRCVALLGVWMCGPVYAFYARSYMAFDAPWDWLALWWVVLGVGVIVACTVGWTLVTRRPEAWSALWRLSLAVAVMLACLCLVYLVMDHLHAKAMAKDPRGRAWQSIWMPRYLGIICPAVLLAMAGLLMRLPTRPLRWGAIGLVLALNLTQGWARVLIDTEPPHDRVARDIIADHADPTTRTVFNVPGNGGTTRAWHINWTTDYYIAVYTRYRPGARGLQARDIQQTYKAVYNLSPEALREALAPHPAVHRLIVWEHFGPDTPRDALGGNDPYLDALGNPWRVEAVQRFNQHQFWNWRWLGWYRRTVYVRDPSLDP